MDKILYIAGAITAIAAAVAVCWRIITWMHRLIESERCQLRHIMLHTYYKNKDAKKVRQYEFEEFVKAYTAYKALNGNSFIDTVYREVTKWEIIT